MDDFLYLSLFIGAIVTLVGQWGVCAIIYSLAPGVSFDLLQHLYKLEHPTVLCSSACIRYRHCGPDICTAGLSVMITPEPQAINQ